MTRNSKKVALTSPEKPGGERGDYSINKNKINFLNIIPKNQTPPFFDTCEFSGYFYLC